MYSSPIILSLHLMLFFVRNNLADNHNPPSQLSDTISKIDHIKNEEEEEEKVALEKLKELQTLTPNSKTRAKWALSHWVLDRRLAGLAKESGEKQKPTENPADYYPAEVDMLKAAHLMLLRRIGFQPISGDRLTSLKDFIDLLIENLPENTEWNLNGTSALSSDAAGTEHDVRPSYPLEKTRTAIEFLKKLRAAIPGLIKTIKDDKTKPKEERKEDGNEGNKEEKKEISLADWRDKYIELATNKYTSELDAAKWDHCITHGDTGIPRDYLCGVWTLLHVLTVNFYKKHKHKTLEPEARLKPLHVIRAWVASYLMCDECQTHFAEMTNDENGEYPMTAEKVPDNSDVFMYVVGAHNSVNLRVGIKNGHDPKYTKQIFPALFLCNNCWKADLTENKPALTRFIVRLKSNYMQQLKGFDKKLVISMEQKQVRCSIPQGKKAYACELCGKSYDSNGSLTRHHTLEHSIEKKAYCLLESQKSFPPFIAFAPCGQNANNLTVYHTLFRRLCSEERKGKAVGNNRADT
ncbi:erv1 / alr family domain-containing protein [Ditylenchus destructor]|uniref:Sulfhydryl oxidase n=1 Tax=Ditylenchus destructor TaxID=166010 RepID=A0AAD4RB60_9BILA|nr:erv1 / alr family domain-containing protein [Ditylenchus destructor]